MCLENTLKYPKILGEIPASEINLLPPKEKKREGERKRERKKRFGTRHLLAN